MRQVNIEEATAQLSKLVEEAAGGEPFVIAKAGKPMVKVVAVEPTDVPIGARFGFMAGEFTIPDDFDTMFQSEIEEMFFGKKA